jgi:hypothetical protein
MTSILVPARKAFADPWSLGAVSPSQERYLQVLAVLDTAKNAQQLKAAMTEGAVEAEEQLVNPLFQFRNYGRQLPHNWSTISNEAAFGTDYTRAAVAKSNIFVTNNAFIPLFIV